MTYCKNLLRYLAGVVGVLVCFAALAAEDPPKDDEGGATAARLPEG